MPSAAFARVAVARPINRPLHYRIPPHLSALVRPGVRCSVPLGKTRCVGFVLGIDEVADVDRVRDVLDVLDPQPCLSEDLLHLGLWLAAYYHHPPGETLAALLPPRYRAAAEPVYRPGDNRKPPPAGGAHDVWQRVCTAREVAAGRFRAAEFRHLAGLLAGGHLVREWKVTAPPPLRRPLVYGLTERCPAATDLKARAPRQAQVVEALSVGPAPAAALRQAGVPAATLRQMETRGWLSRHEVQPSGVDPVSLSVASDPARPALSDEQTAAVARIERSFRAGRFAPLLLQGITGSGKTEVYIRAAETARRQGRGVLVLVPEIGLTPQILGRFLAVFGDQVAILHSALGARERCLQWERIRSGEATVVLGVRSAVFAPVQQLGLVVIDEEHEASYKQEDGLRYHAKHAALVRARHCRGVAVLGSATPDLETLWNARQGRYQWAVLSRRIGSARMPAVQLVDVRQEEARRRRRVLFSEPLHDGVEAALGRGEQVLLFLNRRGFSPAYVCNLCGEAVACRRCSIALTLHRGSGREELVCHYCGLRRPLPTACPHCNAESMRNAGVGTQQVCEEAARSWPDARIVRLDRDAVRQRAGSEVLGTFHRGEADILVGTQMVAKGHHFPSLTVVGVVDADQSLHFPDFRAAERTYQLLTQVAGRAGREQLPGLVFVQTRNPHHPAIRAAAEGDFDAFAEQELQLRREAGFPPFRRIGLVRLSAPREAEARAAAEDAAALLGRLVERYGGDVLGPAPAPLEQVRGRWRYHLLVRATGPEPGPLQKVLRGLLSAPGHRSGADVRLQVDVDPVNLL